MSLYDSYGFREDSGDGISIEEIKNKDKNK